MAYQTNVDYKSLQNTLKQQLAATTDPTAKAQLQSQIDAAEQARMEKTASDISKFGKYASDSELDSAAGIAATNQVGTGYETQKENLNKSYDTANQNANNDALSRGMARSSFVSDRLAHLGSDRANALSDVDAAKANAIQSAKTNILNNYQTNAKNELASQKTEYANTIGAYYNDYQAEADKVTNNNDPSDDWKIPYLQAARNQKISSQQTAQAKADQQAFDNQINYIKATKTSSRSGSGGGSGSGSGSGTGSGMTYSQVNSALGTMKSNGASQQDMYNFAVSNGGKYASQLLSIYGLSGNQNNTGTVTPLTSNYGSSIVEQANTAHNNGYTANEIISGAQQDLANGKITQVQYDGIVDAALRKR